MYGIHNNKNIANEFDSAADAQFWKKEFKKTQNLKTLEILQWKASNLQVKGVISHTNWLNNQVFTYWYFFSSIQTRFHTFIHVSLKEQTDIIQGSKTH